MRPAPERIRERIATVLQDHDEVRCCYLYGSAARGRMGALSDIDLGVAGDRAFSAEQKLALQEEFEQALQRDVDLVDLSSVSGTILRNVMRGECVCCRDVGVKYRLIRKLVYDQEDFEPLRRRMMDMRREAFIHGH